MPIAANDVISDAGAALGTPARGGHGHGDESQRRR